jgi:hypothetical protein
MHDSAQKRALQNYRQRLTQRGMARFEVLGLEIDRPLIRSLAKRLADQGPGSTKIREAVRRSLSKESSKKGNILLSLRRSPLVSTNLRLTRSITADRKVDL